ncbi:MAG: alpha/beta hydrolase [Polyangiales bacterium]
MRQETLDLDGAVNLERYGSGGPTMLMVHGLGGSLLNWRAVAPTLAEGREVISVDLRGHGRSAMPRDASLDENLALLARIIEREVGHSVTLVGNSMGGLLSLLLASSRPELVESMVLVNPALPWTYARRADPLVAAMFGVFALPGLGELYLDRTGRRVEAGTAVHQWMRLCGVSPREMNAEVLEAHVELARERVRSAPHRNRAFLSAARSILRRLLVRGAFEHHLDRVRAPTLLLHGERDRLVPVEAARAVAARRRDWVYDELRDTGHTPMLQSPKEFCARVDRWSREGA